MSAPFRSRVVSRLPSLIGGLAWVTLDARVACACGVEHTATVQRCDAASDTERATRSDADRAAFDASVAWDAVASALADRWAITSQGEPRCPACRTADDCATVNA